jgi:glycosyltransferase involved in cell wall biosynthesis
MARLLLFVQQFATPTTGLGTYARGLVADLLARGHAVTLAVPASQSAPLSRLRVVPMAFDPGNVTPFAFPAMARAVRAVLAAEAKDHDRVHFLDAREAVFARLAGLVADVGTIHDAYALDWRAPAYRRDLYHDRLLRSVYFSWLRWVEGAAYRAVRRLAANSCRVADTVARGYGVPRERIEVVPLGVPPADPVTALPLSGAPGILFVGANYQRKGLGVLLAALGALRARLPAAELHVVGGDPAAERFRLAARRLGLGDRVRFYGWRPREEVRAMMAGAAIFALPALVEAFGLVYLEAMQAGAPVVGTRAGGLCEFVEDETEALLVPPGDAAALAVALERAATDGALRARLAAGGRAVAARHPMTATTISTERLYFDGHRSSARRPPVSGPSSYGRS